MLDATLGALLVIDNPNRPILDAAVVQPDVALRAALSRERAGYEMKAVSRGVRASPRCEAALPLGATIVQPHRQHRADHHHTIGVDPLAQHLGESHIKLEARDGKIG